MIEAGLSDLKLNAGGKKLFLLEEHHIKKSRAKRKENAIKEVFATVDFEHGTIFFSQGAINLMQLDHSFIKFYYDKGNRVVAWRVKKNLEPGQKVGKHEWRLAQKKGIRGIIQFGIGQLLSEFQPLNGEKAYKRLKINRYKDYLSGYGEEFYFYVELKPTT